MWAEVSGVFDGLAAVAAKNHNTCPVWHDESEVDQTHHAGQVPLECSCLPTPPITQLPPTRSRKAGRAPGLGVAVADAVE